MNENLSSQERAINLTGNYDDAFPINTNQNKLHERANEILQNQKNCMLTTADLNSRPMHLQQYDKSNNCLWFFGSKSSPLALSIQENSLVNAAFAAEGDSQYLSVKGSAAVLVDREKIDELWNRFVEVWYPLGKADPNLCLVRIDLVSLEAWVGPETKIEELYRVGKSILTGNNNMDDSIEHFKINYRN